MGRVDSKRTRPSPETPNSTSLPSNATPKLDPNPLCANHSTRPSSIFPKPLPSPSDTPKSCSNAGSSKCSNLACKACCSSLRRLGSGSETYGCEFHEEKERKERQRQQELKEHKKLRKERGIEKAKENELRDKERKRLKQEGKKDAEAEKE